MRIVALLLLLSVVGCAVPAKRHNITKTWTTPTEFDKLWANTIDFFGGNNIPILTLEKDSGIIVSDWFVLSKADGVDIDCGMPGMATAYEKSAKLTVMIRETNLGGMKVTVNGQYKQRRNFDGIFYVTCFSKGKLEELIKESIIP